MFVLLFFYMNYTYNILLFILFSFSSLVIVCDEFYVKNITFPIVVKLFQEYLSMVSHKQSCLIYKYSSFVCFQHKRM